MTNQLATLEPPPADLQEVLTAVSRSQESTDQFASIRAGTMPIPELFDPGNVGAILERAR